jgi:AraC-like DNA-binding protein
MKLFIKYMVSIHCKTIVKTELDKLGIRHTRVELGQVNTVGDISDEQRRKLQSKLLKSGLELMEDHQAILIECIKNTIIEMVHYTSEPLKMNFSDFLTEKLDYNYTYLAKLFSETTGTTIEQYIIAHKIERVKELLIYDELSLTEISYLLHYSSVSHLSRQFKKVTGLTPTFFKNLKYKKRITLENL